MIVVFPPNHKPKWDDSTLEFAQQINTSDVKYIKTIGMEFGFGFQRSWN